VPESPNPLRRSETSRRAILDAALQLCAELGYGRLTVEAIAARAGVSKKTIYRWWPSKGAVVLEAVDGQLASDADLDVALGLLYGPIYHRLIFHLGMPDAEQLRTLIDHALRAFGPTTPTQ
jgi:AcrR family transcriptional regulator